MASDPLKTIKDLTAGTAGGIGQVLQRVYCQYRPCLTPVNLGVGRATIRYRQSGASPVYCLKNGLTSASRGCKRRYQGRTLAWFNVLGGS
jgi:hypothetical protein